MNTHSFDVRCDDCGRNVTIRTVYESVNANGFRGYSYVSRCACGARLEADGCDGKIIPSAMRCRAREQRQSVMIRRTVDSHLRSLPPSATKSMLTDSRVTMVRLIDDASWVVYRLPDGRSIAYLREPQLYSLIDSDPVKLFPDIDALAAHLAGV